jgi:hypothetical protein
MIEGGLRPVVGAYGGLRPLRAVGDEPEAGGKAKAARLNWGDEGQIPNVGSYLGYNDGLRFANGYAGPTAQAVLLTHRVRLVRKVKDIHRAKLYAFFTSIASVLINIDKIDLKGLILLAH